MSEAPRQRKSDLRARMRPKLAAMSASQRHEASAAACRRLMELEAFAHASMVMLYLPLAREVDLTPVAIRCFQTGKTVCVPRVDWEHKDMDAVGVTSFDDHVMEVDEHGLRTPRDGSPLVPTLIDLVVVPGLAFDTECRRLGRGGGFYDRFLGRLRPETITIGLAYDVQIVDAVPAGERDLSVDLVVTDRRVARAAGRRARH